VLALALALALTQTPPHRLRMQPNLPRVASTAAFQLNGSGTPTSLQCTSDPLYTEAPVQSIGNTRASSAYCEKSDGTMVLMSSNTLRRERMGLLVEPASANLIGASGADARDLTVAGWTKTNMTCTKTATGADGAANAASTCTATSNNGTVSYAVVVANTKRSSSMRLKRRTGSGTVLVSRDNFVTTTDVSTSLSSATWKKIWADCGGRGSDISFSAIDNCIAASNMTATAANPTVGVKLGTSGDAVDVDFVQDELRDYPTSPMAGFDRARDLPGITLDGGLPVTAGEISVDWVAQRGSGADEAGNLPFLLATGTAGAGDALIPWVATDTGLIGAYIRNASGLTQLGPSLAISGLHAGRGRNQRITWGSGNAFTFFDGIGAAKLSDGTAKLPAGHTGPYILGGFSTGSDDTALGGWISHVRWRSGTVSSFQASTLTVVLVGDSVVEASNNLVTEGSYPEQVLQSGIGPRRLDEYVTNVASSGNTIDQCSVNARSYIDEAVLYGVQSKRLIVFQCGTNSSGLGSQAVWDATKTLIFDSIDAGVRILPATITPYQPNDAFIQGVNIRMFNVLTDAGIPFADSYHAMEFPAASGILNPAYDFGDGLHVKAAGASAEATVWLNVGRDAGYW
jgi:hypothetical protein